MGENFHVRLNDWDHETVHVEGSLPAMPTQTTTGGDDAVIAGAPPVDDEAILKLTRSIIRRKVEPEGAVK